MPHDMSYLGVCAHLTTFEAGSLGGTGTSSSHLRPCIGHLCSRAQGNEPGPAPDERDTDPVSIRVLNVLLWASHQAPATTWKELPAPRRSCPGSSFLVISALPDVASSVMPSTNAQDHQEDGSRLPAAAGGRGAATTCAEPGTEYDVLVYGELGTLIHTETGLTGTSWTYPAADEIAESGIGRPNTPLRVVIKTWGVARTHQAMRKIEWEVDRLWERRNDVCCPARPRRVPLEACSSYITRGSSGGAENSA
jgi:hypothetical protein